ncbi:hypothetical protein JOF53_003640 [Crossiella equi]|uniref:Uncharacterized protein n=1 Tax=Crossiella equi TaxID=130796 RepID=A0ABS5ADV7_9PSEU|nr:hypothetical protein [Crossiella equi]
MHEHLALTQRLAGPPDQEIDLLARVASALGTPLTRAGTP